MASNRSMIVIMFVCTAVAVSPACAGIPRPRATTADQNDGPMDGLHLDDRSAGSRDFQLPDELLHDLQPTHWLRQASTFVDRQRRRPLNRKRAKNVVLFLGDGMSVATLAATRAYAGGVERPLPFERFPAVGMARTYCVDAQVADSACSSTAYLSGVKANYGTIGVTAAVPRGDCELGVLPQHYTESIAGWAQRRGSRTGLVTTTRVTHASPAGVYAHTAERDWENNKQVKNGPCKQKFVDDIAMQLVFGGVGAGLNVVMGGGRREFRDKSLVDEEGRKGDRSDGRDLIAEWLARKHKVSDRKQFIWHKTDLLDLNANETDYLLALFEHSHCRYNLDIADENIADREPSLTEMVDRAIDVLQQRANGDGDERGFFLFVEGGRIDQAHHETLAQYALEETAEFGRAVARAQAKLGGDDGDTLIVVTADHSHTMTMAGYADRTADVLDTAGISNVDNMAYMTLSYANGPGYAENVNQTTNERINPLLLDTKRHAYTYPSMLPLEKETHGGDDVAVFASGPWAHLFEGTYEQNALPHLMAYAACWGDGRTMCDDAVD